jgi:hypothetical protein
MSLQGELSRARHAQRSHAKQKRRKRKRKQPLSLEPFLLKQPLLDEQVLSFKQWCQLNSIGERNGRRILKSGNGPVVTRLSDRRIGITVGNNRRWQEARARS